MIREISASDERFNGATFRSGFNLVLGASTKDSTDRDSTNGVGKSSLVELFHFALASEPDPGEFPRVPALAGWEFRYKLELDGRTIDLARAVDSAGWVVIGNPEPAWGKPRADGTLRMRRSKWSEILRQSCFNSRVNTAAAPPSFRQLIRHFVRYKDADFNRAFDFLQGKRWQSRRVSAFILGLDWELQALVGELEEKNEIAKSLRTKTGQSVLHGSGFDRAGLEAEASRLGAEADDLRRQLDSFRVHEQYAELEREADQLTARLASLSDENVLDEERIRLLGDAVSEVADGETSEDVRAIYEEAGLLFPDAVLAHLESLTRFHRSLIRNRRDFLAEELQRKSAALVRRREEMKTLDERRGEVMRILRSHGALDQFQQLHGKLGQLLGRLEEVRAALERTEHLATLRAEYKAEVAKLERRAAREHESRRARREYVQRIYSLLVKEMYSETGKLVLDDTSPKYSFELDIRAIRSTGVGNLATACVDLMVARLWSEQNRGPRLLVHDSRMFDGMDHRQVGHTLRTAKALSEEHGFTYIALYLESSSGRRGPERITEAVDALFILGQCHVLEELPHVTVAHRVARDGGRVHFEDRLTAIERHGASHRDVADLRQIGLQILR